MTKSSPLPKFQNGPWVRLYLTISESQTLGSGGTLYYKDVSMCFLPDVGEQVYLGFGAESQESEVGQPVAKRYWEPDGTAIVQMKAIRIDPPSNWHWHTDGKYETTWQTSRDGDLHEFLKTNDWKVFKP